MKVSPNILTGKPASACGFYTITRLLADARARATARNKYGGRENP